MRLEIRTKVQVRMNVAVLEELGGAASGRAWPGWARRSSAIPFTGAASRLASGFTPGGSACPWETARGLPWRRRFVGDGPTSKRTALEYLKPRRSTDLQGLESGQTPRPFIKHESKGPHRQVSVESE